MRHLQTIIPILTAVKTGTSTAPWPVWSDSTTSTVKFTPTSKATASKLYHALRAWDRATHVKHKHGGILGRTTLAVIDALLWEFLNYRTGRLDPSHQSIANKAGLSIRTVQTVLNKLRDLKIITWIRRCEGDHDEQGHFRLRQKSSAYGFCSPKTWLGWRPAEPPPPHPSTAGFPPPMLTPLQQTAAAIATAIPLDQYATLMSDQSDRLAVALAKLGRLASFI